MVKRLEEVFRKAMETPEFRKVAENLSNVCGESPFWSETQREYRKAI